VKNQYVWNFSDILVGNLFKLNVHEKSNDFDKNVGKFWYKIIPGIKVVIFNWCHSLRIP
jgi:hypothetical protein